MERYSIITEKNPREIVLLRGSGCKWRRCAFCDYHLDFNINQDLNDELNFKELNKITGLYHKLEVINSGSFVDLSKNTINRIIEICKEKDIREISFECHWLHHKEVPALRKLFKNNGIKVHVKIGVETFDYEYREKVLFKGIDTDNPANIAKYFDDCCLLFGLKGQTVESMENDVETALKYFDRVCINIMVENSTKIKPCQSVIKEFKQFLYPKYINNERVDILLDNKDFGVGD